MLEHVKRQFQYDHWANVRILDALDSWKGASAKATGLMAHLITAEVIWLNRMEGNDSSGIKLWPDLTLTESRKLCNKQYSRWKSYLDQINDDTLDRPLAYRNTSGKSYHNSHIDLLQHVVIHGQHHRAQIAALLRTAGITPPATDYISFIRSLP